MDERFYADGSLTVEAAFIVPVIVTVLYSIVLLAAALFNRVKLMADVETCLTGLCMEKELPDERDSAESEIRERLMSEVNGYVGADPIRYSVRYEDGTVRVRVTLRSRFDGGPVKLFSGQFLLVSYETERKLRDRSDTLRKLTAVVKAVRLLKSGED